MEYNIMHIITNPVFTYAIYLLFHAFFQTEGCDKKRERLAFFCYFVCTAVLVFMSRIPLVTLSVTIVSFFLLSFLYPGSLQKRIIYVFFIYSILIIIEAGVAVSLGFMEMDLVKSSSFYSVVGLILIRSVTLMAAYLISKWKRKKHEDFSISKSYYIAFSIVLTGTLYLFLMSLQKEDISPVQVVINGCILLVVNMTMIVMDKRIHISIQDMREKDLLMQQNMAYINQAAVMEQSLHTMKAFRHDMKNHILMLEQLYANQRKDEIKPYIKKIYGEDKRIMMSESGHFVIDSIVNFKLQQLRDTDVEVRLEVRIPEWVEVAAYDITVILGNLLDNAATAVRGAEKKILELFISYSMGNMVILLKNSHAGEICVSEGRMRSTKRDDQNHGYGLENIEKILENCGGEMRMEYTKDLFMTEVILPCGEMGKKLP